MNSLTYVSWVLLLGKTIKASKIQNTYLSVKNICPDVKDAFSRPGRVRRCDWPERLIVALSPLIGRRHYCCSVSQPRPL